MPLEGVNKDTVQIDLATEGEFVRVVKVLGKADRQEIATRTAARAQVLGIPVDEGNDLLRMEAGYATLSVVIREWGWKDRISIESVKRLDDESLAVIFERLAELYPPDRKDDDLKNSPGSGAAPSWDEAPSQPSSAG